MTVLSDLEPRCSPEESYPRPRAGGMLPLAPRSSRKALPPHSLVEASKPMGEHRIFSAKLSSVYPLYVQKAERKGRTKDEVDRIICWLTGYSAAELDGQLRAGSDIKTFFAEAPALHPNSALSTGVVCGVRVENVEDPLMRKVRYLDKLIDELAKGKTLDKILRQ